MVPLALFGWIPLGLSLFWFLPVRKALVTGYLLGWLFLPQAGYSLPGLPDYTRMTAVNLVMFLGVLFRDPHTLLGGRLRIWDIPIFIWCLHTIPTSLSNGLGIYNGLSGVLGLSLSWGIPYWIGRAFFRDGPSIRLLATGIFVGGLICVPLCLWEMRMSPNLHLSVYGFYPTRFSRAERMGGYRPMLFLQHGIAVGTWMCTTALVGWWLWRSRVIKALMGIPVSWLAIPLLITAVLCRSMNAILLLGGTAAVLACARYLHLRILLLLLFLAPSIYVGLRAPQIWHPTILTEFVRKIRPERAISFENRIAQEDLLVGHAWIRPVFGWGTYRRNRVASETTGRDVVTDSLWIITFGQSGLVGLISMGLLFALPGILLWLHYGFGDWWSAAGAPAAALAVIVNMYAGDCLMNAMTNPIFLVAAGAVIGFAVHLGEAKHSRPVVQAARLRPRV